MFFKVTIPRGVSPGQHFAVLVNGQQMMVRCPESNRPGDRLIITAPRLTNQQFVVTVPPNTKPGQQFRVMINSQEVMVTCPRGVRPGKGNRLLSSSSSFFLSFFLFVYFFFFLFTSFFFILFLPSFFYFFFPLFITYSLCLYFLLLSSFLLSLVAFTGQRVTFQLPPMETPATPAPNHQMFEVAVPEGVR